MGNVEHSVDKMHRDIQKAIASASDLQYDKQCKFNAYIRVRESSAEQIAEVAKLHDDDVWYRYYCCNQTKGYLADELGILEYGIRLLMHQSIARIANAFLEREV